MELAHEKAPVSVTQVMPAAIDTPFFENSLTRLGVRPSGPPPVYPPEKVAEAILAAAQHPKRDVVVGGAAKAQLVLQRISPRIMDAFSLATAFKMQRSKDPKSAGDANSLFEPVEGDDRVHGVVSTTQR